MLNLICEKHYKNILIPSLGTGDYGFEHSEVGKIINPLNNFHFVLIQVNLSKYYNML